MDPRGTEAAHGLLDGVPTTRVSSRVRSSMEGTLMRVQSCVLLLTLVGLPSAAGAAPKTRVPALLERARYVALGYDVGDGFVSADQISVVAADALPEERDALEAIRKDIDKWGRYSVTTHPEQAEILIAVRIGRPAPLEARTGTSNPAPGRSAPAARR